MEEMKTSEKKIVCIVQARMSSSRLPEKMMKPLAGKPNLEQVFRQLSFSKKINEYILATSVDLTDDILFQWAKGFNIKCFRGSLDDVLDRFYQAAKNSKADILIRVTGDCPLIDPKIIDNVIDLHLINKFDYTSNVDPPTFPDGYDVEVFNFESLEKAWKNANLNSEREHVTPYIRNHKEIFNIGNYESDKNLEHIRLTLDNEEDYELISLIYEKLYDEKSYISLDKLLNFLSENSKVLDVNKHIQRNLGYTKSLELDKKLKNE